jgi:hypothetical protein
MVRGEKLLLLIYFHDFSFFPFFSVANSYSGDSVNALAENGGGDGRGGGGGGYGNYDSKMTSSSYDRLPTSHEQQQEMMNTAKYFNEKVRDNRRSLLLFLFVLIFILYVFQISRWKTPSNGSLILGILGREEVPGWAWDPRDTITMRMSVNWMTRMITMILMTLVTCIRTCNRHKQRSSRGIIITLIMINDIINE